MDDINFTSVYKSIDDPWIALLVLSILILVTSIITMIIFYLFWRRYQQKTQYYNNQSYILSNSPIGKRPIPVQIEEQPTRSYETQRREVFVPPNNDERLHARYPPPQNDIQKVQQFYERTTKAYF